MKHCLKSEGGAPRMATNEGSLSVLCLSAGHGVVHVSSQYFSYLKGAATNALRPRMGLCKCGFPTV